MYEWPPDLILLKDEKKIPREDHRDDDKLQRKLDSAVAYVEDKLRGSWDFSGVEYVAPTEEERSAYGFVEPLLPPDAKVVSGTILLASRWANRQNTPDGIIDAGDAGVIRVNAIDPDIERMLGIGRARKPMC